MAKRKDVIDNFYNNYDEEERLVKDKAHHVEFVVTKKYIDKHLKEGSKILEVGAGTGRYSLHYANLGYDVTAIEYVEHNLDILKKNITGDMKIVAEQGDAVDMSRFSDNTFDMTLVLGPLYHLYEDTDIRKAIAEAIRVTKKDGIIMIAYITSDGVFADWAVDHLDGKMSEEFDENFKGKRCVEALFAPFYIEEFKNLMSEFDVKFLHNVATDGISYLLANKLNGLTDEQFKIWLDYQLSVCEREDLQGYSCHMLYICQKN